MPSSPSAAPATALETIYRRHQGLVRWVLRARGVPEAALDDHVHDVFLAILRRLPERDAAVPMRAWVAGVARNVSFSHRRTAARQQIRALRLVPPEEPPRPDEELERREAWQALSAFLDDLGPEQREVFVMVEVSGMRVSELAESTGMPANTLHSRLKVARTRFSQRFAGAGEQRAELLQRARAQGRAEPRQRQRTWAMIAASIEGLPAVPGAGAAAGAGTKLAWALGSRTLTAVTLAVGVLGAAAVVESRPPAVARGDAAAVGSEEASRTARGSAQGPSVGAQTSPSALLVAEPASIEGLAQSGEPQADRSPSRERPRGRSAEVRPRESSLPPAAPAPDAAPAAEPSDAELLRAMAAVERARDALGRGQARRALAVLDEHGGSFGMLEPERRRLELDAACRLDDGSRSAGAAVALVRLGATVDPAAPCPTPVD